MIKKGLKVKVLTGKDKNKEGEVIEIDRSNYRAKVKEINMIKKHVKTTKEKKGGIVSKENFIHLSNLKLVNEKIKKGVIGRKKTLNFLLKNIGKGDTVFWFHCASLGEYEQGLPVFKNLKSIYPKAKIVLSFFSPSGYEIRQENPITPLVVYLPLDTKKNVNLFLKTVRPSLVVFVKYELWPNYLLALKSRSAKVFLILKFRSKLQTPNIPLVIKKKI